MRRALHPNRPATLHPTRLLGPLTLLLGTACSSPEPDFQQPDVLFLDEPTASLDPSVTLSIEALIDDIHRSGTKIVMTTHDLGQARRLADEVMFMHRGRVLEHSPATTFFAEPQSEAARAFLAGELFW